MKCIIVLFASIEIISNAAIMPILRPDMAPQMFQTNYQLWHTSQANISKELKDDNSFYRVNNTCDYSMNPGTYYDYNSMSYFTTAENPNVRYVLSKLGLYSSPRIVQSYGLTPITKMLFSVKYDVHTSYYDVFDNNRIVDYEINPNSFVLPLGYIVDKQVKDISFSSDDAFSNTNALVASMTGNKFYEIYKPVSYEEISCITNGINLYTDGSYYYLDLADNTLERGINDNRFFRFEIGSNNHEQVYTYICNEQSEYSNDSYILKDGTENRIYYKGKLSVSYIKPLSYEDNKYTLTIIPDDNVSYQNFNNILFYELSNNITKEIYEYFSNKCLNITEHGNGYISGSVNVTDASNILFTTIPYDPGWTVTSDMNDGIKITPLLNNAFIGIEFTEPGEYNLEFKYKVPGLDLGMYLSMVSMIIVITWILISKRKSTFQNKRAN